MVSRLPTPDLFIGWGRQRGFDAEEIAAEWARVVAASGDSDPMAQAWIWSIQERLFVRDEDRDGDADGAEEGPA